MGQHRNTTFNVPKVHTLLFDLDMNNTIKVLAKKLEQQGVTSEMINTAIEGGIKEKIKRVLIENGYYAGNSGAAKVLREIADEWDD